MRLKNKLLNWLNSFFLPELHDDLHEMPVVLWWRIQKEGDALLLIKGRKRSSKRILAHCVVQWEKLNDDFTDYFGIQKRQREYLRLLGLHQYYVAQYAITKNHFWTTKRLIIEAQLEEYRPEEIGEFNEYEELRNISISLDGANMNPREMSVIQYYSDRNLAIKRNKKSKQESNRLKAKK